MYELSVAAQNDIDQIFDFGIFRFGKLEAERYLTKLHEELLTLLKYPNLGKDGSSYLKDSRYLVFGSHVVFYTYNNETVFIVRVLSKHMCFELHL